MVGNEDDNDGNARAARLAPGVGRGHAEPAGGAGGPIRPHGRLRRRSDRDGLPETDMGRAAARRMVDGGTLGRPSRTRLGRGRAGRGGGRRARLHGLYRRGVRRRRRAALSGAPLDGPAFLPRGGGHQRHRRPGPAVRLGPGLARMDAAEGALAAAEPARALSIGRPDRRRNRLDDAPADRRMDAVAQSRRGQVELRPAGRRLAPRFAPGGRPRGLDREVAGADRSARPGRGPAVSIGGRGPRAWRSASPSPRAGSTPTWGCSAWARPGTATWR